MITSPASNDAVAERAGREGAIRLDEMNGDGWVGTLERARDAGPSKAAADNDDARCRFLREHRSRQQRDPAPRGYGLEKVAAAIAPGHRVVIG